MIKYFHLTFILLSVFSFVGRVILSETHPAILKQKALKIAPHVIDSLLLVSGITLVFQGGWLAGDFGWIVAKIIALLGYIGLGVVVVFEGAAGLTTQHNLLTQLVIHTVEAGNCCQGATNN